MWHKFNPNPHGNSVGDCTVFGRKGTMGTKGGAHHVAQV
nr:MAG TPA: hypothetical protein [Caudoviricetes sp.]